LLFIDDVMQNEAELILKRLEREGSSAQELLPVYQDPAHEALWRQNPELYRVFTRRLISEGNPTRAFDIAREGLAVHTADHELKYLLALALARGGNIRGAEKCLAELLPLRDLEPRLRGEALSLEGRLFKDRYERTRDAARKGEWATRSAASYRAAAEVAGADAFPRINAATMLLLSGDNHQAKELATRIIEQLQQELQRGRRAQDYWKLASLGEASLILEKFEDAAGWYRKAVARAKEQGDVGSIAAMRRNALLLKDKLDVGDELLRLFFVGSVVVFSGHMLDQPGQMAARGLPPRFPADPQLIRRVSEAIKESVADLNATVGFCSAACGSDILFAEHMLARDAELHIVLPFARQDFYATSVDFDLPAMRPWRARFDALLERATQVHHATAESYLGDEVLFDFATSFLKGLAIIRAGQRGVIPQALVVLDARGNRRVGGTSHFLDAWIEGKQPSKTIDLAALREQVLGEDPPAPATSESPAATIGPRGERHIKSMLFADVKDFSKLREEDSPRFFLRFLQEVDGTLRSLKSPPTFGNTWGDGLYLVFDQVTDCAEAALRLLERAEQVSWKDFGIGATTPVRIGIHAGPVFSGHDPIIGKKNYFGSHVNRAARIEPVTIPGCAYASEQFAALLAAELGHDFVCEYIGVENLAKEYDRCPLYRLARR